MIRLKKSHALTVIVCGILLAYQNCAQAPDSSSNQASEFEDGLGFAYDAKVDTIAYMSCSEISSDMTSAAARRAYFTFRLGAYEQPTTSNTAFKGGLMLTPKFRNDTQYYTAEARAQALAASALNGNTSLNLSFRNLANVQKYWSATKVAAVKVSTDAFLPPLTSAEVAGPLSAYTGGYLQYFPGAGSKRVMEASLNAIASEAAANDLRQMLTTGGTMPLQLVMGYGTSSDAMDHGLKVPAQVDANGNPVATPANLAYGSGFRPTFKYAWNKNSGDTMRVLASVTEFDMTTGRPKPAAWQCPQNYQFMVVRPEDAKNGLYNCRFQPDNQSSDPDALNKIRRVLRAEDWYVDIANHCVMQKGPDLGANFCYGQTLATRTIDYNSAACNFFQPAGSNVSLNVTCPHYVSVCVQ